jgi:hypothetical protein
MQSKLEDVLREKERELKLHSKFESLRQFCEKEVFPLTDIPLQRHIETLKGLIEKLIPEPRHRREEMFSGELFVLLCMVYFHDIGAIGRYGWTSNEEILNSMEAYPKTLFLNTEIGKRLRMPEKAVELVNSLIFSARKIPIEWEIIEDTKKAIVRNARILSEVFNFAHLMWDIFSADSAYTMLRRLQNPDMRLRFGDAELVIDSREGLIHIKCDPQVPYQVHVLARVREHVETLFKRFKENVNGRLGFQYREIVWDIGSGAGEMAKPQMPAGLFPFNAFDRLPFIRWAEASQLLDTLFKHGHVIVAGGATAGKTTMINSFVVPQLKHISPNVFYAEIWEQPVHQVREAIDRAGRMPRGGAVDIVSTCKQLSAEAPCFIVIDGCERYRAVKPDEREKFERFVEFCLQNESVYLIALGDKEEFFEWYRPFKSSVLSAVFEVSTLDKLPTDAPPPHTEVVPTIILRQNIEEIVARAPDVGELKEIVAVFTADEENWIRRYSIGDIVFETCMAPAKIAEYMELLQEKGILRRLEEVNTTYYVLTSRHLKEHLRRELSLDEFSEKRRIREAIEEAAGEERLLSEEMLARIEAVKGRMMFGRKELGLILASLIVHEKDWADMLRANGDGLREFDYRFLLALLSRDDVAVRRRTLELLAGVRDDALVNPLLEHLRRETDAGLRDLLVKCFVSIGKRRTAVALMTSLSEIGDTALKIKALDYIYALPARKARDILVEVGVAERDPDMIERIDTCLAMLEE